MFLGAGAGGSSGRDETLVSDWNTLGGSGSQAGGKLDPLYRAPTGDSDQPGQVVLQWTCVPQLELNLFDGDGQNTAPGTVFIKPLQAQVMINKMPAADQEVTFKIIDDFEETGTTFIDGRTTVTVITDSSGIATTPFLKAGSTPGVFVVEATWHELDIVFDELEVARTTGNTLTIFSGNNQNISLWSGRPWSEPLVVKVTDPDGRPVSDVKIEHFQR
ncbi:hypothetical protein [Streptomyces lavendulae]|uniref:hypothetical protein n=1 Tax=Streptomyces lavendulae TaxID=1914 RepID=UPI00255424DB|nr:hypothetical protein [Streptomyces lavendulae]